MMVMWIKKDHIKWLWNVIKIHITIQSILYSQSSWFTVMYMYVSQYEDEGYVD